MKRRICGAVLLLVLLCTNLFMVCNLAWQVSRVKGQQRQAMNEALSLLRQEVGDFDEDLFRDLGTQPAVYRFERDRQKEEQIAQALLGDSQREDEGGGITQFRSQAGQLEFRTINGVAARIISLYSRMYNRTPPDLIQNENDTAPLLTRLWQETNHEYPTESTLKDLRTAITYIKNMCLTDDELDALETDIDNLPELYRGYQRALKAGHRMDYDDQLCFALQILRGAPAVAKAFRGRYQYFCVDESQDTSKVQHEIIRVLAQESGNIFMVGDEDQSIYGFRAAYPQALMDFEKTYPGAQILLMEQNYRSTEPILEAANRFVARNRYRRPKTIAPTQGPGAPLQIVTVPRRADQLPFLFETAQHCDTGTAVLFRNHESALPIIDLCERRGIPYACKAVDQTFFTNKIVRDVTDIFFLHSNTFQRIPQFDPFVFMELYRIDN